MYVCLHILCLLFQVFQEWNKTELDSFLIEITANILKFKDSDGKYLLPKIKDSAGQKGTGKWTAISALEYGVPVTLIGKQVFDPALSFLPACRTLRSMVTHSVLRKDPTVGLGPQKRLFQM